ncbi:MAG: hypothetical protein EXR75_14815 [Myxococcales bacterium]|nr:hypothetical protein [Myxococcales bacterium]
MAFWRRLASLAALLAVSTLLVRQVRGGLCHAHASVREKHDAYMLPPPPVIAVLSLGYKSAVADILWAHVLVTQGLYVLERRRFENLTRLYDAINTLDPSWRTPYLLVDALMTLQTAAVSVREVVETREILERGVKHRPFDTDIWLNLGQFVGFIAPSSYFDETPEMIPVWRREGAVYLARAAEIGGDEGNAGWQSIGGASILAAAGERDAALRFLERAYAVTEDPELKTDIERRLRRLVGEAAAAKSLGRIAAMNERRKSELPWVSETTMWLLGPRPQPSRCAGPDHTELDCAMTWREFGVRFEGESNAD